MRARKVPRNNHLEEALAVLIQNQAAFLGRVSEMDQRLIRMEGNIEAILRVLSQHAAILEEHTKLLEGLPESIRQKIGFKPQK